MFKTIETESYIIKLEQPDNANNLANLYQNNIKENNIKFFRKDGVLLYDIGYLLNEFSKKHNVKYNSELYFDIKITESEELLCIGFTNHCMVGLKEFQIKRLINNK